jgi:phage regulator Rha-like protein
MFMKKDMSLIPAEIIENKIYLVRGVKVMIDRDLAELYQVETRALIQAVKRNSERFPSDFMFQLSEKEVESLKSQTVISKVIGRGGRRYLPYAFTEQGVAMLSAVLKSKRAVQMSIIIVRAFIKLREMLATHKNLIVEFEKMKRTQKEQGENIDLVMRVINKLISSPSEAPKEPIGFRERK